MRHPITAAYFSPTGGTKRALETLCSCWAEEVSYVELGAPKKVEVRLGTEDLLVLALPVYAGLIPDVPGLLDGLHGQDTPCVLAAAYGNRHYDNAPAQMKEQLARRGFRCAAAAAVITPHIFAPTLGAGRPDGEDREVLSAFAKAVEEKLAQPDWREAELPGDPNVPRKKPIPVEKHRDMDICLGCAFCARVCPTGAMSPATLEWDNERCISCMACVSHCPVGALGYNSTTLASRLTENFSQRRPVETFI